MGHVIPTFLATQQVEVARVPRASQNIVAAGQGIVAQQIVQTAGQIGQAVVDVATVDFQKQQSRDRVTFAQLRGQLDDFEFLSAPDPTKWKTIEDGQRQQVRFVKDWERKADSLAHGQSLGVQQDFKIWAEDNRVNAKARYARKRVPMERAWALSQIQTQWASRLKNNAGDPKKTKQDLTQLIDDFSPYLTPSQVSSLKIDVEKSVTQFEKTLFLESVAVTTRGLPFEDAINFINEIPRTQITETERSGLKTQRTTQQNIQDIELETQREADRDEISQLIHTGQSASGRINTSLLDEAEQFTWMERERQDVERRAKRIPIITNQSIKGDLESMAYNIHNGSVVLRDFRKNLDATRYDDKSIDDSDYDELRSLATREFKTYQSNEMGSRISFARNQLVTAPSDLGFAEQIRQITDAFQKEQAISLRKLEMDNLDQYRKALNDWFKDNPDADADEIYTKGRSMLAYYRKTPAELRGEVTPPTREEEIAEFKRRLESEKFYKFSEKNLAEDKRLSNQIDILKLQFNLSSEDVKSIEGNLRNKTNTLDEITRHLQRMRK